MHKFLRAAGFGDLLTETDVHEFLKNEVIKPENLRTIVENGEGSRESEYVLSAADDLGLCAVVLSFPDGTQEIEYNVIVRGVCITIDRAAVHRVLIKFKKAAREHVVEQNVGVARRLLNVGMIPQEKRRGSEHAQKHGACETR